MYRSKLTASQQAIWIGQKLHPKEPLYNMVMLFTIYGKLDVARFSKSFQQLVEESEAMRLVFEEADGEVFQKLSSSTSHLLEYIEIKGQDFDVEEWATARGSNLLDLTKTNFDSALIKHDEQKFTWFINQHHIATDLSSFRALYNRLKEIYYDEGNESPVLPSYLDYVNQLNSNGNEINSSYEGKMLEKRQGPFGNDLPKFYSSRSTRYSVPISKDLKQRLNKLLEDDAYKIINRNTSYLTFFVGLFSLFLKKINGRDTLIGLPTHNRFSEERKRLPGLVMNVIPLKPAEGNGLTFRQLFEGNKNAVLNYLFASQLHNNSAERLAEIEALLNYIPFDFYSFGNLKCDAKWLHIGYHDAQHYIRLHVQTTADDSIEVYFDLNDAVFSDSQRAAVVSAFLRLMECAVETDTKSIDTWSFFTEDYKKKLAEKSSLQLNTSFEMKSILKCFQWAVREYPNELALVDGERGLSYANLNDYSNALANYLVDNGLEPQQRVGVLLDSSLAFIKALLALIKCNAVLVPIDATYPPKRVAYMLKQSGCKILLTSNGLGNNYNETIEKIIDLDAVEKEVLAGNNRFTERRIDKSDLIYLLFTSGTSGRPKGVRISHGNIESYLNWAQSLYMPSESGKFSSAFFTSVGFDLTYTSLFLPLITGGTVKVYPDFSKDPIGNMSKIFSDDAINLIKLTPSHIKILSGIEIKKTTPKSVIVGGEQFTAKDFSLLQGKIDDGSAVFNEYGPTEATIGCIIHKLNANESGPAIPIGKLAPEMSALVLDNNLEEVTAGLQGELFLSGPQLALGYENDPLQTSEKFIRIDNRVYYKTGDIVRVNSFFDYEYFGRSDGQIKVGSRRVEKEEIENVLAQFEGINACTVWPKSLIIDPLQNAEEVVYCIKCALPNNYPGIQFNSNGLCELCEKYEEYKERSAAYFKSKEELYNILKNTNGERYDCIVLLSGGKDSSFALAKLAEQNLRILAFTLDNGFLSKEAMENIDRVVAHLGVEHIWARTPAMKEVFVDSLNRYSNVCDGCFKVIYTLAIQLALEKNIPYIITGLSRGQFFETRLTEELFLNPEIDPAKIDEHILTARKAYHSVDDAVKRLVATQQMLNASTFQKVQFLDFYRYYDVSYSEMMKFLSEELPWLRPQDTGRSTNCLINDLGIYVHKKHRGFHNYALPYSWDVRLGHKTREQAIKEFDDQLEEAKIYQMAHEIGFEEFDANNDALIAFYTSASEVDEHDLKVFIQTLLPAFMVPSQLVRLQELPLTNHGKIDQRKLGQYLVAEKEKLDKYVAPRNDIEEYLAGIWAQFLQLEKVSIFDNFIALGGHSLVAIRILSRLEKDLEIKLPLVEVFEHPSVAAMAKHLEALMEAGLNES